MKRVLLSPAYVLHRRSYRETSYLVELFTPEHGRLTVVARGVSKPRSSTQGLLQPFTPLLVSFAGKGELMSLTQVEANGVMKQLHGECLFAGFYLNELLMCLLQKWDAHATLYTTYEKTLTALQSDKLEEKTLRLFEKKLLEELGYGLLPKSELSLHNTFSPERHYRFIPEHGFVLCDEAVEFANTGNIFSGKSLIAIAKEDGDNEDWLFDAKRLIRFVLAPLLGERPIYSRRLFMEVKNEE
jgi:DNA repair protein RecO (recombination protein O)